MGDRNIEGTRQRNSAPNYRYAMDSGSYVGSPYNFVPFPRKLYDYDENRRPKHNEVARGRWGESAGESVNDDADELYSGEMEYIMTAQTPILIDGGEKDKDGEFNKLPYFNKEKGNYEMRYAIPGSTVRGLIRNNVQILGFCGFADDVDDYALMYRAVASGSEHDHYMNDILGFQQDKETLTKVKAGYIKNIGDGRFQLIPIKKGEYYILKEKEIGARYYDYSMKKTEEADPEKFEYAFFVQKNSGGEFLTQYKMPVPYTKKQVKDKEKITYEAKPNKSYLPYAWPVSYKLSSGEVIEVRKRDESLTGPWLKGYVVSSGAMYGDQKGDEKKKSGSKPSEKVKISQNGKQVVYILPEPEIKKENKKEDEEILISQEDISAFCADLEKRRNSLRGNLPLNYEEIENRWNSDDGRSAAEGEGRDKWMGMAYFDLPKEGDAPKPFFYIIEDDSNLKQEKPAETNQGMNQGKPAKTTREIKLLSFGFTPYLRVPYNHTVKDGLPQSHIKAEKNGILDYAQAMFGTIDKKGADGKLIREAFKSRLSFSDLFLEETSEVATAEEARILAEPKPTSYLDYLENGETYNTEKVKDGNGKDSNGMERNFQLRGVKQYWLHESLTDAGRKSSVTDGQQNNELVWSTMKPLCSKSVDGIEKKPVFRGKIRFKNLTKDELGLLLWSARLEANSQMNLGKGKAYGFGRVKVDILGVRRIVPEQAYNPDMLLRELKTRGTSADDSACGVDGSLFQKPFEDLNADELIDYYKKYIGKKLAEKYPKKSRRYINIMEESHIRAFFRMKDVTQMPDESQIRYMDIDKGEYQKRTAKLVTLPKAMEVPPKGMRNSNVY